MKPITVEIEGETYQKMKDGLALFDNDGTEATFDAPAMYGEIRGLNHEAKTHREARQELEAKLKAFEGIKDPSLAKKALETVANLDTKQLVEAGKVDEIKAEAIKATEAKFQEALKASAEEAAKIAEERDAALGNLNAEMIGGSFSRSKFVQEKVAIPARSLEAQFGKHFKVDGRKVYAVDASGNPLYSKSKPGELASFEEGLSLLIESDPDRDNLLVGSGKSGTEAPGGDNTGGGKTMSRAAFEQLSQPERMTRIKEGVKVT